MTTPRPSWRSAIEEPRGHKISAARICAILSSVAAVACAGFVVRFAFLHEQATGMAAVLAGLVTTLGVSIGVSLHLRKATDEQPPPAAPPQAPPPGSVT